VSATKRRGAWEELRMRRRHLLDSLGRAALACASLARASRKRGCANLSEPPDPPDRALCLRQRRRRARARGGRQARAGPGPAGRHRQPARRQQHRRGGGGRPRPGRRLYLRPAQRRGVRAQRRALSEAALPHAQGLRAAHPRRQLRDGAGGEPGRARRQRRGATGVGAGWGRRSTSGPAASAAPSTC
jgi:hypothetical protein